MDGVAPGAVADLVAATGAGGDQHRVIGGGVDGGQKVEPGQRPFDLVEVGDAHHSASSMIAW